MVKYDTTSAAWRHQHSMLIRRHALSIAAVTAIIINKADEEGTFIWTPNTTCPTPHPSPVLFESRPPLNTVSPVLSRKKAEKNPRARIHPGWPSCPECGESHDPAQACFSYGDDEDEDDDDDDGVDEDDNEEEASEQDRRNGESASADTEKDDDEDDLLTEDEEDDNSNNGDEEDDEQPANDSDSDSDSDNESERRRLSAVFETSSSMAPEDQDPDRYNVNYYDTNGNYDTED